MFELDKDEKEELDTLKRELAECEQAIEKHYASEKTGKDYNPEASIGGIRSRTKRQKRKIIERYDNQARRAVLLQKKIVELKRKINSLEKKPERLRKQWHDDVTMFKWWQNLKAGDTIDLGGNSEFVIKKKNRLSIVIGTGTRYTMQEITGISSSRAVEIVTWLKREN